jgi:high affinity Mn2+ porin
MVDAFAPDRSDQPFSTLWSSPYGFGRSWGGISINGKNWSRPYDTIGIAGAVNSISGVHQAFLDAGGLGILIGDGQLPNPGSEKIFETYYSYAFSPATRISFDYQFITNPAYNSDRGPAHAFAGRFHSQF